MGEVDDKPSPRYSSNKVADINTELSKMKETEEIVSLKSKIKNLEAENEKGKQTQKKLLDSLEETKVEISSLKENYHSQDSSGDDSSSIQDSDIESLKLEMETTKEALAKVKNELKSAIEAEITSNKAMDDLALALKEVATDCSQTKEKLTVAETELEGIRLESKQWKDKYEETKKEAELLKNTSERLRIEAEESLLAWNGKESVFVSIIKRGENEKNSLLDENNRLLEALVGSENLTKKAKEENHKVRDILKQAISEANVAKEAVGMVRAENSNLKDTLLDKEEELEFALKEIERVKVNESLANDNVKKLNKLLSEIEVAMEEERNNNKTLMRQDSLHEVEKKKKKEKKEQNNIDKKMVGKTCSFSLMKLAHAHNKHKETTTTEEESKALTANANAGNYQDNNYDDSGEGNSPSSDSYLFKGSIFDVAETPQVQKHHKRRSSCTFLEEVETINTEDLKNLCGNHLDEGELSDKEGVAAARKKRAFIRRFGDLLGRRKSLSFSHKKESSTDSQDKQDKQPQTPPSPSQPPMSPEP